MANKVTAQVLGGQPQVLDGVETIQDVLEAMELGTSYQATMNGDAADLDDEVYDFSFVSFTEKVKGAKPRTILIKGGARKSVQLELPL